ncbi:unnamed protein product [Larinioides sclopetarius]|uniref:Uncharacterized protein n=1 Tax=Larinioides sclopetarius TaxID=280406 RepID=A0AAV2BXV1_9ARAC
MNRYRDLHQDSFSTEVVCYCVAQLLKRYLKPNPHWSELKDRSVNARIAFGAVINHHMHRSIHSWRCSRVSELR